MYVPGEDGEVGVFLDEDALVFTLKEVPHPLVASVVVAGRVVRERAVVAIEEGVGRLARGDGPHELTGEGMLGQRQEPPSLLGERLVDAAGGEEGVAQVVDRPLDLTLL